MVAKFQEKVLNIGICVYLHTHIYILCVYVYYAGVSQMQSMCPSNKLYVQPSIHCSSFYPSCIHCALTMCFSRELRNCKKALCIWPFLNITFLICLFVCLSSCHSHQSSTLLTVWLTKTVALQSRCVNLFPNQA